MATVKLGTLVIRTLAKPISSQLKNQAKQHEVFRSVCVGLAQRLYRAEVRLRTGLLGEPAKHIRPLSETKAIENGANALAEGFLFAVAATLIFAESWRSSSNQSKRRDVVDDRLDSLETSIKDISTRVEGFAKAYEEKLDEETQRNEEIMRVLERVVEIGLRGGWAEFENTPIRIPRIELSRGRTSESSATHNPTNSEP